MFDKLLHWKIYKDWKAIKSGKQPVNMKRGAGYYIAIGLLGHNPIGKIENIKMQSGKTAIAKLIDYKTFRDPDDMVEESYWHIMGYEGQTLFKDMTFKEYLSLFTPNPKDTKQDE